MTVLCSEGAGWIEPGESYRFLGEWREHPTYGRQFVAAAASVHIGHDRKGVVTYLAKTCTGIGQAIANRLWEAYGETLNGSD